MGDQGERSAVNLPRVSGGLSVSQATGEYFVRRTFIAAGTSAGTAVKADTRRVAIVFMRLASGADIEIDTVAPGPTFNGFGLSSSTPVFMLKWQDVGSLVHEQWLHGGTPVGVGLTIYEVLQTRA